jgi:AAA15 family ATPase/GTPase
MFKEITLKNYRTHKLTTIKLKPVTLLIGNNNSGKTNFLAGIQHFCELIRRSHHDENAHSQAVKADDYFPHRYRFARDDEPMRISIQWIHQLGEVGYQMELHGDENDNNFIQCKEKITIKLANANESKEVSYGYDSPNNSIFLRRKIDSESSLEKDDKSLCKVFFRDFESIFNYHFQPLFLKGLARGTPPLASEKSVNSEQLNIPTLLGREGSSLQNMIRHVKEYEEQIYTRFVALMRRFERTFHGIRYEEKHHPPQHVWEFDLGRTDRVIEGFASDVVSDGLMKVAAIALLASLDSPPALILLEEIENGVNPGNIQQLMYWIWQTTALNEAGYSSQFILTSHSPSVLREFHEHLDHVYTFRLDKSRFQSDVRNLSETLDVLVGVGTVEGEIEEESGKRVVKIPRYKLPELWYSGTIG